MSHNQVKELSSLIGQSDTHHTHHTSRHTELLLALHNRICFYIPLDTWQKLVTLDLSHNMITALHVGVLLSHSLLHTLILLL